MRIRAFLFLSLLTASALPAQATFSTRLPWRDEQACGDGRTATGGFSQLLESFNQREGLTPNPGPLVHQAAIYGRDNRVNVTTTLFPWRAIGRLNHGETHCTATMISECYALTAAHCVATRDGEPFENLSFSSNNGGPTAQVERVHFGNTRESAVNDWAIVKLDRNVGEQTGWFGLHNVDTASLRGPYVLAGFNQDLNGGRLATADQNVMVRARSDYSPNFLFHNANSAAGSSGGPLFFFDRNNNPWIVGVNTRAWVQSNGNPTYFPSEPSAVTELATAVATAQFYSRVLYFMSRHPLPLAVNL